MAIHTFKNFKCWITISSDKVISIPYSGKHKKISVVMAKLENIRIGTECMSAELDNKAAVSSLFTEIISDVTADDAQHNLVRFLAK